MDLTFRTPEGRFNCRTAGLMIHEGKILVMRDGNPPYYYLPGGRVSLHESSEEALGRELWEELQTKADIQRLCYIAESFFIEEVTKEKYHEQAFYYLVRPTQELLDRGEDFIAEEGKERHHFYWKSLDELPGLYFQPAFLKEKLSRLPDALEHLIVREYGADAQ